MIVTYEELMARYDGQISSIEMLETVREPMKYRTVFIVESKMFSVNDLYVYRYDISETEKFEDGWWMKGYRWGNKNKREFKSIKLDETFDLESNCGKIRRIFSNEDAALEYAHEVINLGIARKIHIDLPYKRTNIFSDVSKNKLKENQ